MSIPTVPEMFEYEGLREEFRLMPEAKDHPKLMDLSQFRPLLTGLDNKDSLRIVYDKCVRYNRYLELRILIAPYLYDLLLKNGIKP